MLRFAFVILTAIATFAQAAVLDIEQEQQAAPAQILRVPGCVDYAWDFQHDRRPLKMLDPHGISANGWGIDVCFRLDDTNGISYLLSSTCFNRFGIYFVEGSSIVMKIQVASGGISYLSVPCELNAGCWYQLAVTQGTDGIVRFYLNGELLACRAQEMPGPLADVGAIGCFSLDNRQAYDFIFKGLIDRPRVHTTPLDENEIRQDYFKIRRTLPIVPMPRQFMGSGETFARPDAVRLELSSEILPEDHRGRFLLETMLKEAEISQNGTFAFVFCNPQEVEAPAHLKAYLPEGKLPEDGYLLDITQDGITAYAETSRAGLYAVLTLRELFKQSEIPSGIVFDWPEFPVRAGLVVVDSEPPVPTADWMNDQLAELADSRMKYVMLRTHDWAMIDQPGVRENLVKYVEMAARNELIVMPYLQSYSHAKGFLFVHPEFAHSITINDESVVFRNGTAALAKHNVVNSTTAPIVVTAADGTQYKEGTDYVAEITPFETHWDWPPDSTFAFPWARPYISDNGGICTLKRLADGRIAENESVNVTYDISSLCENTCPYLPEYREYLAKCIREALEITGSDCINLGLDEIWTPRGSGRCCASHPATIEETFGFAFNDALQMAREVRPDVIFMAFSDMLDPIETPDWKVTDVTPEFDRFFDKGISMMPWYYGDGYGIKAVAESSTDYFLKRGFPVIGISGKLSMNQVAWGEALYPRSLTSDIKGFVYTMWDAGHVEWPRGTGYKAYAQMTWSPDRFYLPHLTLLDRLVRAASDQDFEQLVFRTRLNAICALAREEYRQASLWFPLEMLDITDFDRLKANLDKAVFISKTSE